MKKSIFDSSCIIRKKPFKGGWYYVTLKGIDPGLKSKTGMIRVKGTIDHYSFERFHLLPMKTGGMLLPVKSDIRNQLGKSEGDRVHIQLFLDSSKTKVPEIILESLKDSPRAFSFFETLSDSNKKYYIEWIQESKRMDTKIARILKLIQRLERKEKFWDWTS